jgi:hypothetical protein
MGNTDTTLRNSDDDSDAYVTFDRRSVILDLPDDGRVADLLPGRGGAALSRPLTRAGDAAVPIRTARSVSH